MDKQKLIDALVENGCQIFDPHSSRPVIKPEDFETDLVITSRVPAKAKKTDVLINVYLRLVNGVVMFHIFTRGNGVDRWDKLVEVLRKLDSRVATFHEDLPKPILGQWTPNPRM